MLFTEKQQKVFSYDVQHEPTITILDGAVRTGKTYINNFLFVKHVSKFENQNKKFLMLGYTIPSLKKNILDDLQDTFGIDTRLDSRNSFSLFGNTVLCFGCDDASSYKSMRGFTAYGAYVNEATLIHQNSLTEMFKRCSGSGFRIFMDTNPDSPNHYIKKQYIDKAGALLENGQEHIKNWHFVLDDNTFLTPEYIESLKKTTPSGMHYDRDILGLWVSADGMIYKDFNQDKHIIDTDKLTFTRFFAGVDWGFEHLGAITVFGELEDRFYLIDIVAEKHKDINWWKEQKKHITLKHGKMPFYCDSARPEYVQAFNGINANKSVVEGISYIASLFKQERLFISNKIKDLVLDEIFSYCWDNNEKPRKTNDDVMDSIRYALYSRKTIQKKAPLFINI